MSESQNPTYDNPSADEVLFKASEEVAQLEGYPTRIELTGAGYGIYTGRVYMFGADDFEPLYLSLR
jgi:hypothetical protein